MLRPFIWREWVISFIGVILPYLFVLTFYFWNDTLDYFWYDKVFFPILSEETTIKIDQSYYFMLGIGSLIVLFSFGKLFGGLNTGAQRTKSGIVLMIWLFLLSCLSIVIAPEISVKYFAAMAIPISVFCTHFFVNVKKGWWAELLFILLISSVFVNLVAYYF